MIASAVAMAHHLLKPRLNTAVCVVDATAGNGKDTLFLARYTQRPATVWAFDIQAQAIYNTRRLLTAEGYGDKVQLIQDSHVHIDKYVNTPIDAAMFNLGYLPGSDHAVLTQPHHTLAALNIVMKKLRAHGGMVTVVAYPGHQTGAEEVAAVEQFLASLPQKHYNIGCWRMVNQVNLPPILYAVEKK